MKIRNLRAHSITYNLYKKKGSDSLEVSRNIFHEHCLKMHNLTCLKDGQCILLHCIFCICF